MINEFVYGNYGDGYTIIPSLPFYITTLLSYLVGFLIYGYRCPERYKPGHFDICGHSHQLWHLCVFTAIIMTYLGSLASYEIRAQWGTCPA
jgi:adiponectin receptor